MKDSYYSAVNCSIWYKSMSEKRTSRIQREADQVVSAVETDLENIVKDIPEHGSILTFRESGEMHIWQYADGFKKELPKSVSR